MKKRTKALILAAVVATALCLLSVSAFALTESEVQRQVDAAGRESVTGNIFIWFLCAVAFLKVSQKIDSFLSSLGINVGHTGGSMLAEAMIAMRGVGMAKGMMGGNGGYSGHSAGGSVSSSDGAGFMSGGLAGVVSRKFTNDAVKSATNGGGGGIGGAAFSASVSKGGGFANRVIGDVATGDISKKGTISGEGASDALMSYLGYTALGSDTEDVPSFSNVEIGGGRITATEVTPTNPNGIETAMYHAEKYAAPDGNYTTVTTADGSSWYKQYAVDTVERTPYSAPDGEVAYHEKIVKKLPKSPPRKDKL